MVLLIVLSIPVMAQETSPLPDGSFFNSAEFSVILGVVISIVLIGLFGLLIMLAHRVGISVPKEVIADFSDKLSLLANNRLNELRESAPLTMTPIDDFMLVGADWTFPRVLQWLEDTELDRNEVTLVTKAAAKPTLPIDAQG